MKQITLVLVVAGLCSVAGQVHADRLLIEKVEESGSASVPRNGLNMEQVEERFGAPEQRISPIGDPPIARWVYPGFTVYFEYDLVINSVVHSETTDQPA